MKMSRFSGISVNNSEFHVVCRYSLVPRSHITLTYNEKREVTLLFYGRSTNESSILPSPWRHLGATIILFLRRAGPIPIKKVIDTSALKRVTI